MSSPQEVLSATNLRGLVDEVATRADEDRAARVALVVAFARFAAGLPRRDDVAALRADVLSWAATCGGLAVSSLEQTDDPAALGAALGTLLDALGAAKRPNKPTTVATAADRASHAFGVPQTLLLGDDPQKGALDEARLLAWLLELKRKARRGSPPASSSLKLDAASELAVEEDVPVAVPEARVVQLDRLASSDDTAPVGDPPPSPFVLWGHQIYAMMADQLN
mmetsp:Transcript_7805/g.32258  ORF Transcript_7805/g.32258 Transcript_7805/m.32258 type:complete len:223 (+) Transcript_7805:337-1005(+)